MTFRDSFAYERLDTPGELAPVPNGYRIMHTGETLPGIDPDPSVRVEYVGFIASGTTVWEANARRRTLLRRILRALFPGWKR